MATQEITYIEQLRAFATGIAQPMPEPIRQDTIPGGEHFVYPNDIDVIHANGNACVYASLGGVGIGDITPNARVTVGFLENGTSDVMYRWDKMRQDGDPRAVPKRLQERVAARVLAQLIV